MMIRTHTRALAWLLLAVMALSVAPAFAKKDKKKDAEETQVQKPQIDTSKLVWPAPPDIARIKWVAQLKGEPIPEKDTKPKKKKQGWMDRLAGVQESERKAPNPHVLTKPYGIVVDSKGLIYVADTYVAAVFILDPQSKQVSLIRNGIEGRFQSIIGLAIDDNDRLFVSDDGLHQITVFDANHKVENVFGSDVLMRPTGMALDTENRFLYVVDTEKENIAVFDADSFKLLRTIGGPSKIEADDTPGTFAHPTNVAVDKEGNIYVTDTINDRVQIFDADGKFISTFGKPGDGPGFFARPKGIGVDRDGHIWVVDALQGRLQVFDKDGHLLAYLGEPGTGPGQFRVAAGLFIDKQNRVIVSEQLVGRVQVFQYITDAEAAAEKAAREQKTNGGTQPPTSTAGKP